MKNKTIVLISSLIVFIAICFPTCDIENPIMEKWWEEEKTEPKDEEPEYIALIKNVGYYDTAIKEKIVYKTIFEQLPPEIITEYVYEQLPPEIIYQVITEIQTVYETVIEYVPSPPTEEDIIKWLEDPANKDKVIEIIKKIPPEEIVKYLTDEQIQYIVSQQPPQMILQSIKIIGIEYVIFAGDSSTYNGPPGPSANTSLTDEEKKFNDTTVQAMAKLMVDKSTYIAMLHGHANPVTFTDGEKGDLIKLSTDRANAVRQVLLTEYNKLTPPDKPTFDERVSTSGYGGEKVLFGNNTQYTALNRRVEMILFEIVTTKE